ncbi:hypothetical protein IEO21_10179 [Rhodonia placenta]|uniref:Uncharacterized protein n=1 Tax=Rhodonia placenta TaxID=104341 RepID=A0A8H7TX08_9APHY|nr:hypothetical protein IEO21_10179 [Postia placenta]
MTAPAACIDRRGPTFSRTARGTRPTGTSSEASARPLTYPPSWGLKRVLLRWQCSLRAAAPSRSQGLLGLRNRQQGSRSWRRLPQLMTTQWKRPAWSARCRSRTMKTTRREQCPQPAA